MSAVIKTTTPFVVQEALFNALEVLGYEPKMLDTTNKSQYSHRGGLEVDDILTNRNDYYGLQHFRCQNGLWILRHDSSEMNGRIVGSDFAGKNYLKVTNFLRQVETEYLTQYQQHLEKLAEIERQRLEAERKARVEAARQQAIAQAKSQGYHVREKRLNGKIQLVCTRSV